VTRRCNLSCLHCGSDCAAAAGDSELSIDEWIAFVKSVHERFGTAPAFVITGGEPLVYPHLQRLGETIASVLCDGTITGCNNNHASFHVGSIRTHNFADVWETGFDALRKRSWITGTTCGVCPHIADCQGGSIHLWRLGDGAPKFCLFAQ